ncbi:hypothetical protein BLNAU_4402 [Blattamonas nauphoetae]|uniref:Uncharacterized protein n=1 Tax=Blattamonas nauphoetae TaxID=2049346 RepID=A0ABQ9Y9X7_9EUKA|nr:hypothetical protein BLNAU_4402 [Blattamonas nauphoetae]
MNRIVFSGYQWFSVSAKPAFFLIKPNDVTTQANTILIEHNQNDNPPPQLSRSFGYNFLNRHPASDDLDDLFLPGRIPHA